MNGKTEYPIRTEDLKVLVEDHAADLDLYADLSVEGENIEGVTEFFHSERPVVRISKALTEDESRQNRLRTTLTHELGHVVLHSPLTSLSGQQRLFQTTERDRSLVLRCKRNSILLAVSKPVDWMEWQAGYASGAFLMPKTELGRWCRTAPRIQWILWSNLSKPNPLVGTGKSRPRRTPSLKTGGASQTRAAQVSSKIAVTLLDANA